MVMLPGFEGARQLDIPESGPIQRFVLDDPVEMGRANCDANLFPITGIDRSTAFDDPCMRPFGGEPLEYAGSRVPREQFTGRCRNLAFIFQRRGLHGFYLP